MEKKAGYEVRAVTRRQVTFSTGVETTIIPDFKSFIGWTSILQGVDIVIHLAGLAHAHAADGDYNQINTLATQKLAQAAKSVEVDRFVFISSVRAQTGATAERLVSEQDEPLPTNAYGRSKPSAENIIRSAGVPLTIFRPVVIYGRNPKGNMHMLARLAKLPVPLPIASLTSRRSLLGIDNAISAIIFALKNPMTVGETFLLADPLPMTIGEILTVLRREHGRSLMNVHFPQGLIRLLLTLGGRKDIWLRFNGDLVVDTSKFELLGWRPVTSAAEGLLEVLKTNDNNCTASMGQVRELTYAASAIAAVRAHGGGPRICCRPRIRKTAKVLHSTRVT
jgi:nucleoside-diphosphate-sugar epimerase